jgi:AcrR family transcriptional regulator
MNRPKSDKRGRILKAAFDIFLQKGYDAATMDQVAARSRIAKGTLYLYFRDKADLYATLLEEKVEGLHQALRRIEDSTGSPRRKLESIIRLNLDVIAHEYSGTEFFMDANVGQTPEVLRLIRARVTPRLEQTLLVIARVVGQGIEAGEFRRVDPFDVAVRVFGLVNINLMRRAMEDKPIDPARESRAILDFVLKGIARA